jgi:hypothetical protein
MMRGYAIAQGDGTQGVLLGLWGAMFGSALAQPMTSALIHGFAWALNLAIAEWLIRRQNIDLRNPIVGRVGRRASAGRIETTGSRSRDPLPTRGAPVSSPYRDHHYPYGAIHVPPKKSSLSR